MSDRFDIKGTRDAAIVVDDFLSCEKTLEGSAAWKLFDDSGEYRMKWPVAVDGTIDSGSASLVILAYPNNIFRGRFTITLNFPPCIWRLDNVASYEGHTNPIKDGVISPFDRTVYGPHYHSWQDNKCNSTQNKIPEELDFARVLPEQIRNIEQALRWFCGEVNITIETSQIPELPNGRLL